MSASLVGSEMCIRDSCPPDHPKTASGALRPLARFVSRRATLLAAQLPTGCLLYTSDAADDM
eukprot:3436842-Alexandrium_andersonii.AAC.1